MVIAIEREPQVKLTLPDLIARLDLDQIKDREARKYWISRAEKLLPYFSTSNTLLSTAEIREAIIRTEDEGLVSANFQHFEPRYIWGFFDKKIIIPDEQVGLKRVKKFSLEKTFAFFAFHREMATSNLRGQNRAYKKACQFLEEKFGPNHKIFSFLNTDIKRPAKQKPSRGNENNPRRGGLSEPKGVNLPSPEEVERLLRETTRKELIKLRMQIEPHKTSLDTISSQKITGISPVVIGNIVLVGEMIHLREKRDWTNEDRLEAEKILGDYKSSLGEPDSTLEKLPVYLSLPDVTWKALTFCTERLIGEMSGEDGNDKNLLELKEEATSALRKHLSK